MYEVSTFSQDSIVTTHHLNPSKYDFDPLYHKAENFRTTQKHIYITPPSFMNFCPVVPEICRGHVHVARKERRIIIITLKATVIYKIYMQFNKNIQIYLIEIIIIHLNIMLCFQTHLDSCSLFWTHFRGAGKSPSCQDVYTLQVFKKNRYMYQNKAAFTHFPNI